MRGKLKSGWGDSFLFGHQLFVRFVDELLTTLQFCPKHFHINTLVYKIQSPAMNYFLDHGNCYKIVVNYVSILTYLVH